jgi:hypothetical protein
MAKYRKEGRYNVHWSNQPTHPHQNTRTLHRHSTKIKHSIRFNKTEDLANIHTYCPCIITAAMRIVKHLHNLNCEHRYKLSKVWFHLPSLNTIS